MSILCRGVRRQSRRTLDDDVTVLAKGRALHGEGERGSGGGLCASGRRRSVGGLGAADSVAAHLLEVVLVLLVVGHGYGVVKRVGEGGMRRERAEGKSR